MTIYSGFSHWKWGFSIVMLVYQRVRMESYHRSIGITEEHRIRLLVGGFNHLEKYEFVNGKDDIPYIMGNEKCLKPPTRLRIMTKDLFKFGRIMLFPKNGRFMAGVPTWICSVKRVIIPAIELASNHYIDELPLTTLWLYVEIATWWWT